MDKVVWIAIKNRYAKDMNRQPLYDVRPYKVLYRKPKGVILKCGKVYPPERCFQTEEECRKSIRDNWKKRRYGVGMED